VVIALSAWTEMSGVINGTTALMIGVVAEAIYATIAVRPLLTNELSITAPAADGNPLTYSELFWFHLPLAGTSLLILLVQPMVTFSLARLDSPTENLAAWPVVFQIMLMARAAALALPEAVIALTKGAATFAPVRRFSINLALVMTGLLGFFVLTPAAGFYIFAAQDMTPVVGGLAQSSLIFFLLFPGLTTIASWLRGLLINHRATRDVNVGMGVNMMITAVVLAIGLLQQWSGLLTAAAALNLALIWEIFYLARRTQRQMPVRLFQSSGWKVKPTI